MSPSEPLDRPSTWISTDRVFSPAYTSGDRTVIPAIACRGAGGSGAGHGPVDGEGGGYIFSAKPAGALVIDGDSVRWKIPFDLNKAVLGGQLVGVAFFAFAWLTERSKAVAAVKVAKAAAEGPARN